MNAMTHTVSMIERLSLFEDLLNRGVLLRVRATGRSMIPLLHGGEILTIRKVPASSLRKGDLVFFKNRGGHPVIHRIVRKQKYNNTFTFQTRGHALIVLDEPVPEGEILGRVCRLERGSGHTNFESIYWRVANYALATVNLFESRLHLAATAFKNILA